MERYPQVKVNLPMRRPRPAAAVAAREARAVNAELNGDGRVLVRPSGTEPLVRVLAEAPTEEEAEALCARIAALVSQELG